MKQTFGVALVLGLATVIGLAVRWLSGTGQRGAGSDKEMDPWEHRANSVDEKHFHP